ncbi:site-specific integrase [Hymenobacter sp. HSC-4F20]|uniref:site-specific integrase n=1 Tax=Hymenobacter sp. HSC-4F20 TaxID=2864135 RepID=UPI001C737B96|nr:site-specific integrase [Hymenobacter sp. HSC-4F20]MBX0289750.1 site-specific integrase [Hymenobacter sp. HSC-4F20]
MSVKIVLRKKPKTDGSMPLCIRITRDRKSSYVYLGHHVQEKDWDAKGQRVLKSHPNSARLNNLLIKKLSEATDKSIELETVKVDVSSKAVKQKIKPKHGATFAPQADQYLENLSATGRYNQFVADKPRVERFKAFVGGDTAFADITPAVLAKFRVYLKATFEVKERTIINHLVVIRSVYSQAMKAELVDRKHYPFGKDKTKIKYPESVKIGLSQDEVTALEQVELVEPFYHHARNLWLISFYFAGMRVSDLLRLKWSDIRDGRLHYQMGKNDKVGSLKVREKALRLLAEYDRDHELIFPDLRETDMSDKYASQRRISFTTGRVDKVLRKYIKERAGISGALTMHMARHTFAQLAGDKVPLQMLQKLYRHSNITTTIGYQSHFIHKDADAALDAVLGT